MYITEKKYEYKLKGYKIHVSCFLYDVIASHTNKSYIPNYRM